jgi:hypothetical protein
VGSLSGENAFLSAEERARLAVLSSIVRLNKSEEIYREGQHTDAVFNMNAIERLVIFPPG